jgi:DNA helicase-2/ATP-dependent DNA helicase PcrA
VAFRDIAVLVRSRAAYGQLLDQFGTFGIPIQPGGRSGLFDQPHAEVLGKTFVWLGDVEWGRSFKQRARIDLKDLLADYERTFFVAGAARLRLRDLLQDWKRDTDQERWTVDLLDRFYLLLAELGVRRWDLSDPLQANAMGTLARFSTLLADYEAVRRRARPDDEVRGEQVGGPDRGIWYYKHLAIHIVNYASDAYGDFDGEPDVNLDAVDLLTVHAAKGLEWPVVFVPSMTKSRFPARMTGRAQDWPLDRGLFDAARYEGSDDDERRLFYVAMTRARDWLSVSSHEYVGMGDGKRPQRQQESPYLRTLDSKRTPPGAIVLPEIEGTTPEEPVVSLTYSELAQFLDCGMQYRLRTLLGFQPRLAPELGYGKAVHHMLRRLADRTQERGEVPNAAQIATMLDRDFFLPTANKPAHRNLKAAAERLLREYAARHQDDLFRVWESERPFELRLDGITVTGRADVILDREDGVVSRLAILDYKTSSSPDAQHDLQLQVYAEAGRREDLDVRAAYVHDLKADLTGGGRRAVDLSDGAIGAARAVIEAAAVRFKSRRFDPNPGDRCAKCEVRTVCRSQQG